MKFKVIFGHMTDKGIEQTVTETEAESQPDCFT